jgi:hypothetical protein
MTAITISLCEERLARLCELAAESGLSPEAFLRTSVERWLASPEPGFSQAARYVLQKNAELHRRLT